MSVATGGILKNILIIMNTQTCYINNLIINFHTLTGVKNTIYYNTLVLLKLVYKIFTIKLNKTAIILLNLNFFT